MIRLTALLLLLAAFPAKAQGAPCGPRDDVVGVLETQFAETRLGVGLTPGGGVLELFTGPKGTWTAVMSMPTGISCIVAAGEAWGLDPPIAIGDPA